MWRLDLLRSWYRLRRFVPPKIPDHRANPNPAIACRLQSPGTVWRAESVCNIGLSNRQSEAQQENKTKTHPVHPGEILSGDFTEPCRLSRNELALDLGVSGTPVAGMAAERRPLSPGTALRPGRYCKTAPRYWRSLQRKCDWDTAADEKIARVEPELRPIVMTARQEAAPLRVYCTGLLYPASRGSIGLRPENPSSWRW
jgi:antitoxin HigA-1